MFLRQLHFLQTCALTLIIVVSSTRQSSEECLSSWPMLDQVDGPVIQIAGSGNPTVEDVTRSAQILHAILRILKRFDLTPSAVNEKYGHEALEHVGRFEVASRAGLTLWPRPSADLRNPSALILEQVAGQKPRIVGLQYTLEPGSTADLDSFIPVKVGKWAHIANRCTVPTLAQWTIVIFPFEQRDALRWPEPSRERINLWSNTIDGPW